jgi:hypothetical protein
MDYQPQIGILGLVNWGEIAEGTPPVPPGAECLHTLLISLLNLFNWGEIAESGAPPVTFTPAFTPLLLGVDSGLLSGGMTF